MYIQEYPYSKKEIDKFIVSAYKKGKKKVIHGNKKYIVDKEIDRIRKYIKFREPKSNNTKKNNTKTNKKSKKNKKSIKK
tara:strand:+ start:84 stop:320 length:237 start_codon:yes stop_codon:yes gene_type:complete